MGVASHVPFVHLGVHTQYSLLNSACRIPDLVRRAVELKFPALAMTDQGNLFGAVEFYEHCKAAGLKPILGMHAYVAPQSRFDKTAHGIREASFQLYLLAKDLKGYKNLVKLSTIGYLEGFYYRPRVDKEMLKAHGAGLIAILPPMQGEVSHYALVEQHEEAERALREYLDIFGIENLYLGVENHGIDRERRMHALSRDLSKKYGLRRAAMNSVYFLTRRDSFAHEALLCIGTNSTLDDPGRSRLPSDGYFLKSCEEMQEALPDDPEAFLSTLRIADECCLEMELGRLHLPVFRPPDGKDEFRFLEELCRRGLEEKLKTETVPPDYEKRLQYELEVIRKMNFSSYFLIVWDFIRFAKQESIPVGPGRGSAAGSIVSYALDITELDPLKHGLLFERFLNPDRISMPDIDIDFCQDRRDEVIRYVTRKYGQDSVAQIITFGTMLARAVIRDVGRVMGMSYSDVDRIAKLVPMRLAITLEEALKEEPQLRELEESDSRVKDLLAIARSLEGLVRHASTHAAGVVIADRPLTEYCPLFKAKDGSISTQFDMASLEKMGILKIDFLGLRTLTVIDETVKILERSTGSRIDMRNLDLEDAATYELLSRGETSGVFQLESSGMRDILRKLKPSRFEDVTAILALYRPGPLGSGMVEDFIKRRHQPGLIKFDHPALSKILEDTYGVILYQEQVMQIANQLAGFSMAQADSLRKAMGKKIPEIMDLQRRHFLEGTEKRKVPYHVAEKIWNLIVEFAGYGFNKSHSAAYAYISFQTAWLKAHHPLEFMTAILTSEKDNTKKIVAYIEEAKRLGITLLPPSVNQSSYEFICKDRTIYFGLSAIKNVGSTAIDSILASRAGQGEFKSLFDFTSRIDLRVANRKVLESLIKSGSLDCFGLRRSQLMAMIDRALEVGSDIQRDRARGQANIFDLLSEGRGGMEGDRPPDIEEWNETQLLQGEKETLGFYVSSHPLARFERLLRVYTKVDSLTIHECRDQETVTFGGLVESRKEILTRQQTKMCFLVLQDLKGSVETVVFPDLYEKTQSLLAEDATIFVRGTVDAREAERKILATDILRLEEVSRFYTASLGVDLKTVGLETDGLRLLRELLAQYPGKTPVFLNFREPGGALTTVSAGDDMKVEVTEDLFSRIEALYGEGSVKIEVGLGPKQTERPRWKKNGNNHFKR